MSETPTMRVILEPSFHPEVAFTLQKANNQWMLRVIVLRKQFWANLWTRRGDSATLAAAEEYYEESVTLSEAEAGELQTRFDAAYDRPAQPVFGVDGMSFNASLASKAVKHEIKGSIGDGVLGDRFATAVVKLAWKRCANSPVRTGLQNAAEYFPLKILSK